MQTLKIYYPDLTAQQLEQCAQLQPLYSEWNEKINVISRKDIDQLYVRHVLHSMAIAQIITFDKGTKILDIGTGGGFPGIPLAILFPDVQFHLVDSIGKKIKVVEGVATALGLQNVTFAHTRAQEVNDTFDFVVSRAVMPLNDLAKIARTKINKKGQHNVLPNGLLCLKGGVLDAEIAHYRKTVELFDISDYYAEEYFETKKVVYLPL